MKNKIKELNELFDLLLQAEIFISDEKENPDRDVFVLKDLYGRKKHCENLLMDFYKQLTRGTILYSNEKDGDSEYTHFMVITEQRHPFIGVIHTFISKTILGTFCNIKHKYVAPSVPLEYEMTIISKKEYDKILSEITYIDQ